MTNELKNIAEAVREFALSLPEAYEDYPWGERVAKVNKKIFVFLGTEVEPDKDYSFGVKLPLSGIQVLELGFTKLIGYNLGKSGWITVRLSADNIPAFELLQSWVEESYRAIAPKKLVAQLTTNNY